MPGIERPGCAARAIEPRRFGGKTQAVRVMRREAAGVTA